MAVWGAGGRRYDLEEHGILYTVDPIAGQKTGFFLDQRDNRRLLSEVGRRPTWCSMPSAIPVDSAWRLPPRRQSDVISLDASQPAVDAAQHHAELNGLVERHESVCSDVMAYIGSVDTLPAVVILDPAGLREEPCQPAQGRQGATSGSMKRR